MLRSLLPGSERASVLSLVLLSVAAYIQTLTYGFVYDDYYWIVNNDAIRSLRNIPDFFASAHRAGRHYRPLTVVWFALDYAVAGLQPLLYHLENVLLHAVVVVLVYLLLRRVAKETAWLAAAIFAVAPVHTEVVANVTSRSELFATAVALLALLQLNRPLLAGFLLFLSLLAKETAVAAPALAVLLWWRAAQRPDARRAAATLGALAGAVFAFLAAMYAALGHIRWPQYASMQLENPLALLGWAERTANALIILAQNFVICVVPYHLSADYSQAQVELVTTWLDLRFIVWAGFLAAVLIAAWSARRRYPDITFAVAWFFIAVLPVSNLVLIIGTIRGERLLYLPSVGTSLLMAEILAWAAMRIERALPASPGAAFRRPSLVIPVAAIMVLGIMTVARNRAWRTFDSIVIATAQDAPNSAWARFNLGALYAAKGDCHKATAEYDRALALYPKFEAPLMGLAVCRQAAGDTQAARRYFAAAAESDPADRLAATGLARVCSDQADWACAAAAIRRLLAANPALQADPELWRALAMAAARSGDAATAEQAFRRTMSIAAQPVDHLNLAGTLARMGRWQEAAAEYEAAERLGMRAEALYIDWSGVLRSAGRLHEARDAAARGLHEHPGSTQLKALASRK